MKLPITAVSRPADDVDLSPATTATRTGPAEWREDGYLEIPFDRPLTQDEVDAVCNLLVAPTNAVATLRSQLQDYLDIPTPTTAQNTTQVRKLTQLVLDVLDRQS